MRFRTIVTELYQDFVFNLFPNRCINCKTTLVHQEKYICTICRLQLPKTNYHLQPHNPLFEKFVYEPKVKFASAYLHFRQSGIAQKLIHELKYGGNTGIGELLGTWFAHDLAPLRLAADMIVPVPIHRRKRRRRGYNQSEYFARGLSKVLKVPVETALVDRVVDSETQTRKTKIQRWKNISNVYRVTSQEKLANKKILVVDDVLTTGATTGELVSLLAEKGAAELSIATIATGV